MGQRETAKQIWDYLTGRGWTPESVAAVLGNMQSESGIIADRWEGDRVGNMSGGYGLVQWTPATKYINWAKANGLVYQQVISQCKRLEWEVANNQQFYRPGMTFKQFTQSKQSPEALADIFVRSYERPYNPNQPARQTQARYWFNQFNGSTTNRRETTMQCIYWKPSPDGKYEQGFYFNGISVKYIPHPDSVHIIKQIYKDNNGRDIPEYHWNNSGPWWVRLDAVCAKI